jgi:hypothetical protein
MKNCKAKRLQKMNPGVVNIVGMSDQSKTQLVSIAGMTACYPLAGVVNIAGMISLAIEIKEWSTS